MSSSERLGQTKAEIIEEYKQKRTRIVLQMDTTRDFPIKWIQYTRDGKWSVNCYDVDSRTSFGNIVDEETVIGILNREFFDVNHH